VVPTSKSGKPFACLQSLPILDDPTAAAVAYGLVHDLRGDTFDVSLLSIDVRVFEGLPLLAMPISSNSLACRGYSTPLSAACIRTHDHAADTASLYSRHMLDLRGDTFDVSLLSIDVCVFEVLPLLAMPISVVMTFTITSLNTLSRTKKRRPAQTLDQSLRIGKLKQKKKK
jgi:hypothetical protein